MRTYIKTLHDIFLTIKKNRRIFVDTTKIEPNELQNSSFWRVSRWAVL